MSVTTPVWTASVWNNLKYRERTSKGGWSFPEQDEVGFLRINGEMWGMDFDPAPDPDPPNNTYPMGASDWNRISGGELLGNNCIRKQGSDWKVEAVSQETKFSRVVGCSE
jgi:hypothetical protein